MLADLLANAGIAAIVRDDDGSAPADAPADESEDERGVVLEVSRGDLERAAAALRPFREPDATPDEPVRRLGAGPSPIPSSRDPAWRPIAALALVHAALLGSTGERDAARLVELGALRGPPPPDELYRLVTSTFLHADAQHLAVNTAYLAVFAFAAIRLFGLGWAALAYALGGVAGSVGSLLLVPPDRTVVGASGAIFALAAATLAGRLRLAAAAPLRRRERWRLAGFTVLLLPGVFAANWAAHLGGFLSGAGLGLLLPPGGGRAGAARLAGLAAVTILAGAWTWRLAGP